MFKSILILILIVVVGWVVGIEKVKLIIKKKKWLDFWLECCADSSLMQKCF